MIEKKIVYLMIFTIALYFLFTKDGLSTIKIMVDNITKKNQQPTNQPKIEPKEVPELKQSGDGGWKPNMSMA